MDVEKIGKFIAELRRNAGMTQEDLGEVLGVTNKTVSRWETGVYMPDIEMLQLLAGAFYVSINELLAGQRLSDDEFRKTADENLVAVSKQNSFTFEEKRAFFKRKWRRDHIGLFILLGIILLASIIVPILLKFYWLVCFAPLIAMIGYIYQNNRMMIYVEAHLFD